MSDIVAYRVMRPAAAWLRSPPFDLVFLLGGVTLGLTAAFIGSTDRRWFNIMLFADLWLLGYHHVISTSTRLLWDRKSAAEHRLLLTWLPVAVAVVTLALALGIGLWSIVTVYFYWQWFHYTRQSWGVSRVYLRKSPPAAFYDERIFTAIFWIVPIWGVLHRSAQNAPEFLGLAIRFVPVPALLADAVGVVALAGVGVWLAYQVASLRQGRFSVTHAVYMTTHFAMFGVGYVAIDDTSVGWLAINIWHNLQYIMFVWLFNANKFRDGIDPDSRVLSWLSQRGNWPVYFAACLGLTVIVYTFLSASTGPLAAALGVPIALVVYQALNFHHYIVDSVLWKVRRPALQKTLGLQA